MTEHRTRSLAKAISYRLVSSVITGSTFFVVTQKGSAALGVGLFDLIIKTGVFYLHERAWIMISVNRSKRLPLEEKAEEAA
jgi:uncharacterized membrane protein